MYFPPPPRGGGFVRAIFVTLALVIFGFSLIANVYLLMLTGLSGSFTGGEYGTRTNVIQAGDPAQKVAVIPIAGMIDAQMAERFERLINQVEADRNIRALVLEVDTPGGTVTASDQIYNRILKFKAEKNVPVVTSMGAMATSGGYYVACATDDIVAQPTTLTGNIGVVMQRFNFSGTMEKLGVEDASITPDEAGFKNVGSPFRPETPEGTAYLREFADDFHTRFKTIVSTGREGKLQATIEKVSDGKAYTAGQAMRLGLVDRLGYPADAYEQAAKLAGLSRMMVVRYQQQPSLLETFGLRPGFARGQGMDLKLDSRILDEVTTPKAMYIWRGE
jgi:protease IV